MTTMIADELGRIPMSPYLVATLKRAADYASQQLHREVTLEHLLLALAEDPEATIVLKTSSIDLGRLASDTSDFLGRSEDRVAPGGAGPVISPDLRRILEAAAAAAQQGRRREINGAIVLAAIVGDGRSPAAQMLRSQGLTFEGAIRALQRAAAPQQPAPAPRPEPEPAPAGADVYTAARERVQQRSGVTPADTLPAPEPGDLAMHEERERITRPAPQQNPQPSPPPMPAPSMQPAQPPAYDRAPPQQPAQAPAAWTPPPQPAQQNPTRPPPPRAAPPPNAQAPVAVNPRATAPPYPPMPPPAPMAPPPGQPANPPWTEAEARRHGPPLPQGPQPPDRRRPPAPAQPGTGSGPFVGNWPVIEAGQLVENVPRRMRVAVPVVVEARIARANVKALAEGLQGGGAAFRHEVVLTKAMSVRLRAPEGGFTIETRSPETQWIENVLGLAADDYASWRWTVTPRTRGKRHLQIIVSARTVGADGLTAETALPDQTIEVKVSVNYGATLKRIAGWTLAAIVGGVLSRFGDTIFDAARIFIHKLISGA